MKNYVCIALTFIALLASCSENGIEEGGKYQPKDYSVKGKVEKGPFVSGSTINLQPMDEKLQPFGSTFSTTITDHLRYVPVVDLSKKWTDAKLFKRYGITKPEQDFIKSVIKDINDN